MIINFLSLGGLVVAALGLAGTYFSISSPALGSALVGLGIALPALMFFPSTYILFAKGLRDTPWLAWLISFPALGAFGLLGYLAHPHPINDISTDLSKVPPFQFKLYRLPIAKASELLDDSFLLNRDYNQSYAALQLQAYPELKNLEVKAPAEKVFPLIKKVVVEQLPAWTLVHEGDLRFEAEVRSALFRFVDDIAVEVRPAENPIDSVIAVRSRSRLGKSDLGANVKRINNLLVRFRLATEAVVAEEAKSRPAEPKPVAPAPKIEAPKEMEDSSPSLPGPGPGPGLPGSSGMPNPAMMPMPPGPPGGPPPMRK
jgi:uncharacterized protein (DUF1499 family)